MSRVLILGPGGLRGAYGGGVVSVFSRNLGPNYFDRVYGCSAGAYTGCYYLENLPDRIETLWRERVCGSALVRWDFKKALKKEPMLNLGYLEELLRDQEIGLTDLGVKPWLGRLKIVATDCQTGLAEYFSPASVEELYSQLRSSAAVPYIHPPVAINGRRYIDGGLSDPFPVMKAINEGASDVTVVCNKNRLEINGLDLMLASACAIPFAGRKQMIQSLRGLRSVGSKFRVGQINGADVRVVIPSASNPLRWHFDSSKPRLDSLFDLGQIDGTAALDLF